MKIYKVRTDAAIFDRYFILAEDMEKALKKAKSIINASEEIRNVEYIGEIAEANK